MFDLVLKCNTKEVQTRFKVTIECVNLEKGFTNENVQLFSIEPAVWKHK